MNTTSALLAPTAQTYAELEQAFDHFNARLFGGQLPRCLLTLQREKQTCGYFSAQRFGDQSGNRVDEIALNPAYFAVEPLQEIMQTIVHEMVHLWQWHFGTPGRGRYHNDEWANKMESIGLMPSSTGEPGGRRTGDRVSDYAITGGPFDRACQALLGDAYKISWYDRFPPSVAIAALSTYSLGSANIGTSTTKDMPSDEPLAVQHQAVQANLVPLNDQVVPVNKSNRLRYSCGCDTHIWGKPGLRIQCLECHMPFMAEDTASLKANTSHRGET
jgi:predicted SprT family Zn-dependent metalloprotease